MRFYRRVFIFFTSVEFIHFPRHPLMIEMKTIVGFALKVLIALTATSVGYGLIWLNQSIQPKSSQRLALSEAPKTQVSNEPYNIHINWGEGVDVQYGSEVQTLNALSLAIK